MTDLATRILALQGRITRLEKARPRDGDGDGILNEGKKSGGATVFGRFGSGAKKAAGKWGFKPYEEALAGDKNPRLSRTLSGTKAQAAQGLKGLIDQMGKDGFTLVADKGGADRWTGYHSDGTAVDVRAQWSASPTGTNRLEIRTRSKPLPASAGKYMAMQAAKG